MRRPEYLPSVDGFDDQTDDEAALAESYSRGLPTANVDDISIADPETAPHAVTPQSVPMQGEGRAMSPMKSFAPQDKADLDAVVSSKLASQPPPPPPGSMMPKGELAGAPPPMPMGMPQGFDDDEADRQGVSDARERDDRNRLFRGLELAGKQLTAGILRQPVAEVVGQNTDYEGRATQQAAHNKSQRSQLASTEAQRKLAAAHQQWVEKHTLDKDAKAAEQFGRTMAETERHNLKNEEIGKDRNAATRDAARIAQSKAGDEVNNNSFTFDGERLEAPKGIGQAEVKELKDKADLYNAALTSFDSMAEAIQDYIANPSADSYNNINSRARVTASAMTAAIGGGAMAEGEAKAATEAMGADPKSFLALKALFDTQFKGADPKVASASMLAKLKGVRDTLRKSGRARFLTHNYTAGDGGTQSNGSSGKVYKNAKGEQIRWNGSAWEPVK